MKKLWIVCFLLAFAHLSFGYISGIAIQTPSKTNMQVFVNGKLYNKRPESFVRIKSQPGLFHIQVKVLNPHNKIWYVVKKDIRVEKGLEFYYKIVFKKGRTPELVEIRRYPVYSPFFLNYSLYNRHHES